MTRQAEALALRQAGKSWAEIARELKVAIGTARVMVGREVLRAEKARDEQRERA